MHYSLANRTITKLEELKSSLQKKKQRILCVISSFGSCVVYRKNGNARLICTEHNGYLCNQIGSVYYQWKWDKLKQREYEWLNNDLFIDVT